MEQQLKYTSRQVADAAGVEETTLRGYLNRENIFLDGIALREGNKDFRFSRLDALRVAIISRLLARGVPNAKTASGFCEKILGAIVSPQNIVDELRSDDWSSLPLPYYPERERLLFHSLMNTELFAWFDKGSERWRFALEAKHQDTSEFLLTGENLYTLFCGADTYIGVRLGQVVLNVWKRLADFEKGE
jgi:hypothetical protein